MIDFEEAKRILAAFEREGVEYVMLPRLDPENLRIAFGLASLAGAMRPIRRTPGVRKFRSWNEALEAKAADEIASLRRSS